MDVDVTNPWTGQVDYRYSYQPWEVADAALARARDAFEPWSALPAKGRADYLLAIAAELSRRSEEIAKLVTQENGKPLSQSRGEVAMSVDHLRWFAEECRRAYGRMIPHQTPGKRNFVIKHPVGVVAAIAPWNFPLVLSVRKVAPALAAGRRLKKAAICQRSRRCRRARGSFGANDGTACLPHRPDGRLTRHRWIGWCIRGRPWPTARRCW